jgi:uncharacterized protein
MLKASDLKIVRQFRQRLLDVTPIQRLVVYGSRARGDAEPESDLDLFIELPEVTLELRARIYDLAWEVGFENGVVISTFITSYQSITNSPLAANPLLRAIEIEGIVV